MAELLALTNYQIPTLKRGQEVVGKIVSISSREILVEIGGKSEGIITGRELAAAADIVKTLGVGGEISGVVAVPENDSGQAVLSLRKMSHDARWNQLEEKKNSGEAIEVAALEVNKGGVICEYAGLRGFLPASLLAVSQSDLAGKKLKVQVIEVDRQANRLIFSQKRGEGRELPELLSKVKIGEKYAGAVSAVLPFGVFVEVEVGLVGKLAGGMVGEKNPTGPRAQEPENLSKIEGLVHVSEISWENVDDPARLLKVGDKVEVMVIGKDEKTGQLSFSIKQLIPDPFTAAAEQYVADETVWAVVRKVESYGVVVEIEIGSPGQLAGRPVGEKNSTNPQAQEPSSLLKIEGLIHTSKIAPDAVYKEGDRIECSVESVDTRSRRINLVPVAREKPILYR